MRARIGGAWRDVESGRVRINGEWRQISEVRAYISGAWVTAATFAPALSLSSSPPVIGGSITGTGTCTTNAVTITPTGGQAPFTYAWTRVGAGSGIVNSPTSATTTFRRTLGNGDAFTETFRCTATDNFGTTATIDIGVTFSSVFVGGAG